MRALFTFAGGSGHAEPLVPFAAAVQAAGHPVAFAGRHSAVAPLEAHGFAVYPEGSPDPTGATPIAPLRQIDMRREYEVLRDAYADRFARAAVPRVLAVSAEWQPDVIICDEVDFGAMIAAEMLGLPRAIVLVTAAGSFVRPDVLGAALHAVRVDHGLPPDPDLEMLRGDLILSPFPPSLRDPSCPLPPNAVSLRSGALTPAGSSAMPPWPGHRSDRPTVYFTLGTVFNRESGDLFPRVLAGLRQLSVNVVVTVGRDVDVEVVGSQPDTVLVERYLPHASLLPRCNLVVNHAGSGTVIASLAHGLPMVLLPMGADQPLNADRCEQLGAGVVLDALSATPPSIADAVRTVLGDASYRSAAERAAREFAALPGPEVAVSLFEDLARREAAPPTERA